MKLYYRLLNIMGYLLGRLGLGVAYNFQSIMVFKIDNYIINLTEKEEQLINQVLGEQSIDFRRMEDNCHIINKAEESIKKIKEIFKITGYELVVQREKYPDIASEVFTACNAIDSIHDNFSELYAMLGDELTKNNSLKRGDMIKICSGCGKMHGFLEHYLEKPNQTEVGKYANEKANLQIISDQIDQEGNQEFDSFIFYIMMTNELAYSAFRYLLAHSKWPESTKEIRKYESTKEGAGQLDLFNKMVLKEISSSQMGIEYECFNDSGSYKGYTKGSMVLKADIKEDTFEIKIPNRITNDIKETNFRMVMGSDEFY